MIKPELTDVGWLGPRDEMDRASHRFGKCSECHEIICVEKAVTDGPSTQGQTNEMLYEAFRTHTKLKHSQDFDLAALPARETRRLGYDIGEGKHPRDPTQAFIIPLGLTHFRSCRRWSRFTALPSRSASFSERLSERGATKVKFTNRRLGCQSKPRGMGAVAQRRVG